MRILVDENIPAAQLAFGQFAEVETVAGRSLNSAEGRERVANMDALIVRSVTQVNRQLLAGSHVKFVGSTTIGCDHLDLDYLREQGIPFANAPGSNADSVVDYVLSAICSIEGCLETLLGGGNVGVIGHGNVGSRLTSRLMAMGIACRAYDPYLRNESQNAPLLVDLDTALQSNVLCLHAPLSRSGEYPSYHMLNAKSLSRLPQGAVLISAGRGEVIASDELLALSASRPDIRLILDVWEPEPSLPTDLLEACQFGTPHIAGYSADGKLRGTEMVATAMASALKLPFDVSVLRSALPIPPVVSLTATDSVRLVREAVLAVYAIADDDQRMRQALAAAEDQVQRDAAFDFLRKSYPQRRELGVCQFCVPESIDRASRQLLEAVCGRVLAMGSD